MSQQPTLPGNPQLGDLPPELVIFGRSAAMQRLKLRLQRVCSCSVPVLLQGEVGTGKDVLAKFIHLHTARSEGAFVQLHCAGLGDAMYVNPFWFAGCGGAPESSDDVRNTTIYLDQVNELPLHRQRQLVESIVDRDERSQSANGAECGGVRLISSSTCSIRKLVRTGGFRRDLFDLLGVVTLDVPPLRHRVDDIPILAEYFRTFCSHQLGLPDRPFSSGFLNMLKTPFWPGNIRELQSYVYQSVVMSDDRNGMDVGRATEHHERTLSPGE